MNINISRIADVSCRNQYHGYAASSCSQNHFRLIALLALIALVLITGKAIAQDADSTGISVTNTRTNSILPIVMYDSDTGLGLGVKSVFKNYYGHNESCDLLLFGSTKGEQNYAVGLSIPDIESRHGSIYKIAFDFKIEYDKLLESNYFGIGNNTIDNDFQFPLEFFKANMTISHAIHNYLIIGLGVNFYHYSVYNYDLDWHTITDATPGVGQTDLISISAIGRYDTRNSYVNPDRGFNAECTVEQAVKFIYRDWDFSKIAFEFSKYHKVLWRKHILAYRLWLQQIFRDVPYQELSKIGDGWTARGYKAGRFIDKSMALISVEYRFPIYNKLGGVVFFDNGRVWPGLDKFNFKDWHSNAGIGLRLYLENFVARLDLGHSSESTRVFFNFGQVF